MAEADREKWDVRYRQEGPGTLEPTSFLPLVERCLPGRGRALDLAGGAGRNALWLAERGYETTLTDISEVVLGMARERAKSAGLTLHTRLIDLEEEPFPRGPWDLIVCVRFLWRPLFKAVAEALAPGGCLVVVHPTRTNLERNSRPAERHLFEDGELPKLVGPLNIVVYEEGWLEHDQYEGRLVARRPDGR